MSQGLNTSFSPILPPRNKGSPKRIKKRGKPKGRQMERKLELFQAQPQRNFEIGGVFDLEAPELKPKVSSMFSKEAKMQRRPQFRKPDMNKMLFNPDLGFHNEP